MENSNIDSKLNDLVSHAMSGHLMARNELVAQVSPRLRAYVYRSVLDEDATDEIMQEIMLIVVDEITALRKSEAFWGWLFRIASNQIINHYRAKGKRSKHLSFQDILIEKAVAGHDPKARLMNAELGDCVRQAISQLPTNQRQAVSLRCFEEMSFRDISSVLAISEINARVQFHRAIENLRKALKKQGFGKSSLLLAIAFFGKITAPANAAGTISVTHATISGGAGLGAIFAKGAGVTMAHSTKAAVIAVVAAVAGLGAAVYFSQREFVRSIDFVQLGLEVVTEPETAAIAPAKRRVDRVSSTQEFLDSIKNETVYNGKGLYRQKVVFPQGPDGPMLRYMFRLGMDGKEELCRWLQDGNANYYYCSGEKNLYLTNDPLRMLILPSDPPDMVKFIYSQIGHDHRVEDKRGFFTGLVKHRTDNRAQDYPNVELDYAYNTLTIDGLTSEWPTKYANIIDNRDQMHKRGWTYYNISGELNGELVFGSGRVPFVYNKYKAFSPWLVLNVGDSEYIDYPGDSPATIKTGQQKQFWSDDSIYDGFGRPWTGFAAVDSICRDAAREKISFTIDLDTDTDGIVTVYLPDPAGEIKLAYDINRFDDLLRSITITQNDKELGKLRFNYLQDVAGRENEYVEPIPMVTTEPQVQDRPKFWLADLIKS